MKKRCIFAVALLLLGSHSAFAVDFTTELDPVVVTATRTARTADETLASVTIITRDDIERQQVQSVQDVLRGVPGINIANYGGSGKLTSVFLRGTESDHVLVLIDGIKVGSATSGTAAFQQIPIEQIERIEIVRGPRSSLYGSEAIGGVIQIFTRRGSDMLKPYFTIGGGSYGTYNASLGVSGGGKRSWFNITATGIDSEGFNACDGNLSAGCYTIEPDKDGYRNRSGSLRAGYRFENGVEVDAHVLRSTADTEYDGSYPYPNESKSVQQVLGGTIRFSPVEFWQMTLAAGSSRDESDYSRDGSLRSRFDTQRDITSLQNDFNLSGSQLLTLGLDYQDDRIDSTTDYTVTSRDNSGVFGQYQITFAGHDLQLSLRQDENEQFGNHNTGGVAWGYALGTGVRLTAGYGTAFKAPNFNELYYPPDPVWGGGGNPDLKPEKSRSFELGLVLSDNIHGGRWSLNAYETTIDNLIPPFPPENIDQARIRGIETILTTAVEGWDLSTTLTLSEPRSRSADTNGNLLPRRAEQLLRFDADRQFGKYSMGITLFAEGRRYDDLANTRELGGYAIIDLRAEYIFAKRWRFQGRIENLLDKEYQTASFYNQPGRSLFVTLRYQP